MNATIRQYDPNLSARGIHDREENLLATRCSQEWVKMWNSPSTKHRIYKQSSDLLENSWQ